MGRGRSGLGKGGGGKSTAPAKASTPSGISYNQFMKMSDSQKYDTMQKIINNPNIKVPTYLDGSDTSKVMYALGMNNKPTVVSDSQLDNMPGKEIYRTVYETGSMPPPSSIDVLDQIKNGDYTQLSGKGGSVHGRALYFATDFSDSSTYGYFERNPIIMRSKINPGSKIVKESDLTNQMRADSSFMAKHADKGVDAAALYALSHGIDGWYSGTYSMIVNRGALTASSTNRAITTKLGAKGKLPSSATGRNSYASSWATAAIKL